MKPIRHTKQFKKNLKRRFGHQTKILTQFQERVVLFQQGAREEPLYDHPLSRNMRGLRAFSITGDIRVVYRETDEAYEFLDIGSHNQVYR